MIIIELQGYITETGQLQVELPDGLPAGDVVVKIEMPHPEDEDDWEKQPWSEEELKDLLTFHPSTGAEIVASGLAGAWKDLDIPDGQTWVEEMRRKMWEGRTW